LASEPTQGQEEVGIRRSGAVLPSGLSGAFALAFAFVLAFVIEAA